jgi:hypothetical protein
VQVSVLSSTASDSVHWFTATADPSASVFKPFYFGRDGQAAASDLTKSPAPFPAKVKVQGVNAMKPFPPILTNDQFFCEIMSSFLKNKVVVVSGMYKIAVFLVKIANFWLLFWRNIFKYRKIGPPNIIFIFF